jgi:NAD(P)H-dependent flavin oxidoreductase YrpB (nitropropane dioxygenase family)
MIETAITEMFGIKYPIICGAMMWICKPKLCAERWRHGKSDGSHLRLGR